MPISFIIPAFNCATTLPETVGSIFDNNFEDADEVIIVDDASSDKTLSTLVELQREYPALKVIRHARNKGGGAARNTAVEHAGNPILFCLDSDNLLSPKSIRPLGEFLMKSGSDVASFQELRYFERDREEVTHTWSFNPGVVTLADYLAGPAVPGASGNYMFTKESWYKAGGYPEFAGALDTWGLGFRQIATGSKMMVMPNSFYYHRWGHESYWVRDSKNHCNSLRALQIIIPFLELISREDIDYIMGPEGRYDWFERLVERPLHLRSGMTGRAGSMTIPKTAWSRNFLRKASRAFGILCK